MHPKPLPASLLLLLLLRLSSLVAVASSSICYASDGVQSDNIPCNPDQINSTCCMPGFYCISNGLCAPGLNITDTFTPFYVGDCTDPTWSSPECLKECAYSNGNGVQPCPNAGPGKFCCYGLSNAACCSNATLVFDLGVGTIFSEYDDDVSNEYGNDVFNEYGDDVFNEYVRDEQRAGRDVLGAREYEQWGCDWGRRVGWDTCWAGVNCWGVLFPGVEAETGAEVEGVNKQADAAGYVLARKERVPGMQGLRGTELPAAEVDDS
ncbi:hypothetical protein MMC17_008100 [Xylographa soralifera]|nr:hypothetical protein [Xylographa soralifera]